MMTAQTSVDQNGPNDSKNRSEADGANAKENHSEGRCTQYSESYQFSAGLKSLTVAILLGLSPTVAWSQQQAESGRVDDYVKERMRELHIPGLSMAALKEGRMVKASGYGM